MKLLESNETVTLYHGSNAKFDKFDTSRISTGESGDLFGKGFYLTTNEKIAEFYGKTVTKKEKIVGYKNDGIFGSEVPMYANDADSHADTNFKINKFKVSGNILNAQEYKIDDSFIEYMSAKMKAIPNDYDDEDIQFITTIAENANKLRSSPKFRGDLIYFMDRMRNHDVTVNLVRGFIIHAGYDGVKYKADTRYEGNSDSWNYAIYNPGAISSDNAVTESITIFKDFMLKLGNDPVMEAVRQGFSVIFESIDEPDVHHEFVSQWQMDKLWIEADGKEVASLIYKVAPITSYTSKNGRNPEDYINVEWIAVEPAYQRKGYAKRLISELLRIKADKYPNATLIGHLNDNSRDFGRKTGILNTAVMEASEGSVNYVEQAKEKLPENIQDMLFGIKPNPVISYMQSVGMDTFKVPVTEDDQNKFFAIAFPYQFKKGNLKLLRDRLQYYIDDEGMTVDQLEARDEADKAEYINRINAEVEKKVDEFNKAAEIVKSKTNVNVEPPRIAQMITSIVDSDSDSEEKVVILRIYTSDPDNDIGIAVNTDNGKIEIFEENEEADSDLLDAVTSLTSDPEAYETVYSAQNEALCEQIIQSGKIPEKMFFSKNKRYAQGYLQEGRDIITFKIQNKYIAKHSDVDFVSRSEAPVLNARYL